MRTSPTEHIRSFDGTSIAVYDLGNKKGPPILLTNGLGGNVDTWRYLREHFEDRHRIITWDYRGLYRSGKPRGRGAYRMEDHVLDLVTVLDHLEVDRVVAVGWSMGVQLNFEVCRFHPDRLAAIVALNGTFGNPFKTAFNSPLIEPLVPLMVGGMKASAPVMPLLAPFAERVDAVLPLARMAGLVGPGLREEVFYDLVSDFVRLDFKAYAQIFAHLGDHDASDYLPRVKLPTLIMTGERDLFTPPRCSRRMAELVPDAELMILPKATHYAPVECPEIINEALDTFINERVEPPWSKKRSRTRKKRKSAS